MISPEPRNEPQMLRWFRKTYPSYDLQPLLLKRQRELEEAQAFNNWLSERRLAQEGQRHLDDVSRLTEAVHRQVPQLRYARAERSGALFIDPESIKIAFRVRNTDATNPLAPATPNPACFIQRVQVFANGQRCDDINYYGRTVAAHDLLKGREYNQNKAVEGFDEVNDPGRPVRCTRAATRTCCCAPPWWASCAAGRCCRRS